MATWRYYAQRVLTGEWLDRDLELYEVNITWSLSGPGGMTAKIDADQAGERALDGLMILEEWSTAVYAEVDGEIRWGGLLHSSSTEEGGVRALEFVGFSGYPKGRVYDSDTYRLWEADPFDIVRTLWAHVQSDEYANLGVTVDNDKCPVKIGDPSPGPKPKRDDYGSNEQGKKKYQTDLAEWSNYAGEPYELAWWLSLDCGDEIDNVLAEAGAEYKEKHWWMDSNRTQVRHHIELGYPGLGARREDLRFMEGENIFVPPLPTRNGDGYANKIIALGNGEERHMLRRTAGLSEAGRLRRDKVVGAQDVMSYNRLKKMAEDELRNSRDMLFFDSFEVVDHPNAPIGAWNVGDEIRVQTHSGFETLDRWVVVTEMTLSPETSDAASVSVTRV